MNKYRIELETFAQVRLIKDTNKDAQRPFDGGSIYYQPESYPAIICDFSFGLPTYQPNTTYREIVSFPKKMIDYKEVTVNSRAEFLAMARNFIGHHRLSA